MFQFDQCNNNFSLVLTLLLKPVQLSVKGTETIFFPAHFRHSTNEQLLH